MNCKLEDSVFEPFGSAILVQSETLNEISFFKESIFEVSSPFEESRVRYRVSIAFENSGCVRSYSRCSSLYVVGSAFNYIST